MDLILACKTGQVDRVKNLLKEGADVLMVDNEGWNCLHHAASQGHFAMSKMIVEKNSEIRKKTEKSGRTALLLASKKGHKEVVSLLLEGKESIMIVDNTGWSCLQHAVYEGHLEVSKLIVEACPEIVNLTAFKGYTALMTASQNGHEEIVRLLLENNGDTKIVDKEGWTCLHHAADEGHLEVSKMIIQKNPEIGKKRSNDDKTALLIACVKGHKEVVGLLLEGKESIMMVDNTGWSCLQHAAYEGHLEVSKLIVEACPEIVNLTTFKGYTALMSASQNGHKEILRLLLENNGDTKIVDKEGWTCLHHAADEGHLEVSKMIIQKNPEIGKKRSNDDTTALMCACVKGHKDVVSLLLEDKATVMIVDDTRSSCLHYAVAKSHLEVCKMIVKACPEIVNNKNSQGHTALMSASRDGRKEIVSLLLEHNGDAMIVDNQGWTCLHHAALVGHVEVSMMIIQKHPEIVKNKTNDLQTALMFACAIGHKEEVGLLLEDPESVKMGDDTGWSCLHHAASQGRLEVAKMIVERYPDMTRYTTDDDRTALMLACANGREEVVSLLLEDTASVMMVDDTKLSCLHYAASKGHFEVCKMILEKYPETGKNKSNDERTTDATANADENTELMSRTKIMAIGNTTNDAQTSSMLASATGGTRVLSLLNSTTAKGHTALMLTSRNGHKEIVSLLLEQNAKANVMDREGWTCLHHAAYEGHLEVSKIITQKYPDILNTRKERGKTALMFASRQGRDEVVRLLLEKTRDGTMVDDEGWSCLHFAAWKGHLEVASMLVEKFPKIVNLKATIKGKTAVQYACEKGHTPIVNLLLEHNADVMMTDDEGWNCLHNATNMGHLEVSKLILQTFPKIVNDGTKRDGKTALMIASKKGHKDVVSLLLDHEADVTMADKDNWNCLHHAARQGHLDTIVIILESSRLRKHILYHKEASGDIPLMLAFRTGYKDVVSWLLEKHVMLLKEHVDDEGLNILHHALMQGHHELYEMIIQNFPEIVDKRTQSGGKTGLMLASINGQAKVVSFLLEHKGNGMMVDDAGWNCLHHATSQGHLEVCKIILQNHPELRRSTEKKGKTALVLASRNGHKEVVRLLLGFSGDVEMFDNDGWNCLHHAASEGHFLVSKMILQSSPNILNNREARGKTALMLASSNGQGEVVMLLLRNKGNVEMIDRDGWNCLHHAASQGYLGVSKLIIHTSPKMLNHKEENIHGRTALMLACKNGHKEVVSFLLERTGDVMMVDDEGWNCLHHAATEGHLDVLNMIVQACNEIVYTKTKEGKTGLILVVETPRVPEIERVPVVEMLLDHKMNLLEVDDKGWNCFHHAATADHARIMEELLKYEPSLLDSVTRSKKRTAIVIAAERGHAMTVRFLLDKHCNVLLHDSDGFSCLHLAAKNGHVEVLKLLLAEEGDEDYWNYEHLWLGEIWKKTSRLTPESLQLTSTRLELMEKKSKYEHLTALHMAAIGHHGAIVAFLEKAYRSLALRLGSFLFDPVTMFIFHKAQSEFKRDLEIEVFGESPKPEDSALKVFFLDWRKRFMQPVKRHDSLEMLWRQYLTAENDVNNQQSLPGTLTLGGVPVCNLLDLKPMVKAYVAIVDYINARDITGRTALLYLAAVCNCEEQNNVESCKEYFHSFLKNPLYDVLAQDFHRYTILHLAAKQGNTSVIESVMDSEYTADEKKQLCSAKVTSCVDKEQTLRDAVRSLGVEGVGVDGCNDYDPENGHVLELFCHEPREGVIPLHYAIEKCYPRYEGVVKRLVEANKCDLLSRTGDGASAFTIAWQMSLESSLYNFTEQMSWTSKDNLLCPGIKCNSTSFDIERSGDARSPMFEALEKAAIEYNEGDVNFSKEDRNKIWVELMWSMREILEQRKIGKAEKTLMLEEMVDKGHDHWEGLSILHYAAFRGRLDILEDLLKNPNYMLLINRPYNISEQTPMHFACNEKHSDVVQYLKSYARLDDEDKMGRTPYELVLEMWNASPSQDLKAFEALLREEKAVKLYIDKQYRDRQIHVDAGNTALVGAALIASVTFAGWLQPPLGYTEYPQYVFPDSGTAESFAAVGQYQSVRLFWVFNSLSFFFAVSTVVCGARSVLPSKSNAFIAEEVRMIRRWLVRTSVLLVISIVCVLAAFGAAGFAALPPDIKYQTSMTVTSVVGGSTCIIFLFLYFLRLNEIREWVSVPEYRFSTPSQTAELSTWHGRKLERVAERNKYKQYCLGTPKPSWKDRWGLRKKQAQRRTGY